MHFRTRMLGAASLAALLILTMLPAVSAANGPVPVATGLDNPRGITVGADGAVYVAESGRGGPDIVEAMFEGQPIVACLGDTGGVTRIDRKGGVSRIVDLPSFAEAFDPDGPGPLAPTCDEQAIGVAATGPTNVALLGRGTLAVTMGLGGDEAVRDAIDPMFGTLVRVLPNGNHSIMADLVAYEQANDPDGGVPDSNPYGVAIAPDGSRLVADAGGNDLLRVHQNGTISTVAVWAEPILGAFTRPSCFDQLPPEFQAFFPPDGTIIPAQAVTTSVEIGPDGAYYVGILTGFPFARDAADVFRVDPSTGAVTNFTDELDLSYITGIGFGPDGALYVSEFTQAGLLDAEICGDQTPGAVWKIAGGAKTKVVDAPLPTDVAVAADGSVYVTVFSILPGAGQVWKIGG
jgi:DNA-binding beta-propeller fold protein YncE